jgi:hypothetical protein
LKTKKLSGGERKRKKKETEGMTEPVKHLPTKPAPSNKQKLE